MSTAFDQRLEALSQSRILLLHAIFSQHGEYLNPSYQSWQVKKLLCQQL
jgi:hypothetical protein